MSEENPKQKYLCYTIPGFQMEKGKDEKGTIISKIENFISNRENKELIKYIGKVSGVKPCRCANKKVKYVIDENSNILIMRKVNQKEKFIVYWCEEKDLQNSEETDQFGVKHVFDHSGKEIMPIRKRKNDVFGGPTLYNFYWPSKEINVKYVGICKVAKAYLPTMKKTKKNGRTIRQ